MDTTVIMQAVNAAGMNRFTLLRPLAAGESGQPIFLLAGADGGQHVLKWCPGAQHMVGWQRPEQRPCSGSAAIRHRRMT